MHGAKLESGMGRQTAVALSEEDETDLLSFLRADVRISRWAAPSPEELVVPAFPPRGLYEWAYRLWNTAFPWEPEYAQWHGHNVARELTTKFYLTNTAGAPLLEYSRHPFGEVRPITYGRIYWNTDFAVYRGLPYDTAAFGRWYGHVVRWLRKHGTRVQITRNWCQYWLPGAWAQRQLGPS